MALLLAWMHVLVTEGLYDKEYVEAHGFGFEAFAARSRPTPLSGPTPRPDSSRTSFVRRRGRWRAIARRR